jgi:flagellar hook-basal body complex protein FliE
MVSSGAFPGVVRLDSFLRQYLNNPHIDTHEYVRSWGGLIDADTGIDAEYATFWSSAAPDHLRTEYAIWHNNNPIQITHRPKHSKLVSRTTPTAPAHRAYVEAKRHVTNKSARAPIIRRASTAVASSLARKKIRQAPTAAPVREADDETDDDEKTISQASPEAMLHIYSVNPVDVVRGQDKKPVVYNDALGPIHVGHIDAGTVKIINSEIKELNEKHIQAVIHKHKLVKQYSRTMKKIKANLKEEKEEHKKWISDFEAINQQLEEKRKKVTDYFDRARTQKEQAAPQAGSPFGSGEGAWTSVEKAIGSLEIQLRNKIVSRYNTIDGVARKAELFVNQQQ